MRVISIISAMLTVGVVSAVKINCRDCYRIADDAVTKKCCGSTGGNFQTGPTTCIMGGSPDRYGTFASCCTQNKCENYDFLPPNQ